MRGIIRILIVRSRGRPIWGRRDSNSGLALTEEPWHTKILPRFFWSYFDKHLKWAHQMTIARDEEEAARLLSVGAYYDFVVFVQEQMEALIDLIDIYQPSAISVIVHQREFKVEAMENYWFNNVLRLLDWTDYLEFEQLLDKWILSQQTEYIAVCTRTLEGGRIIVDRDHQYE